MHSFDLIITLTAGLGVALLFGFITQRIGLSPIVGYLLAGTLVGPHTPGIVVDGRLAEQLAEIGVILLMFGVGLQFHAEELLAVRRVAVPGAILQCSVATAFGAGLAYTMGWSSAGGSSSASHWRWRVPSSWCVSYPITTRCTRPQGISRLDGSSWKTSSPCSRS